MKEGPMNKLKRSAFCFLVAAILGQSLSRRCLAVDDGDFQFWSTASASFDISRNFEAKFEEELRFGDDAGRLYYHHSDLGFAYRSLADWIDVGVNYRQAFARAGRGEWRQENRPHLNVTLKGRLFDLDVSSRSRLEYRDREKRDDVWRYRNKFTVKLPFELTPLKLKPYLADEVFITLNDDNIHGNRFYSGFSFDLSKDVKADVFYLWQSSRSGREWIDFNVLGFQFKAYF